jgi:hypothetical protein
MGELLSFLITAILIIYVIRALARIFLPMLFQSVVNKAQQQHQQAAGRQQNYNSNANTNTGRIRVDYKPTPKKGSIPDSEGDFVDYEEVK